MLSNSYAKQNETMLRTSKQWFEMKCTFQVSYIKMPHEQKKTNEMNE